MTTKKIAEDIKIESGIPIPERNVGRKPRIGGKLKTLKAGDSFVVNDPMAYKGSFYYAAKTAGIEITIRDTDNGGFRVWRVK